jgi:hypothetical protein
MLNYLDICEAYGEHVLGIKCVPFFTANFVQNISPFDEHWM